MNVEVGKTYWTIHPSTESEEYGARNGDVPWPGRTVCHSSVGDHWFFTSVDNEGRPDLDTNASFYLLKNQAEDSLFDTEEEAWDALLDIKEDRILEKVRELVAAKLCRERNRLRQSKEGG